MIWLLRRLICILMGHNEVRIIGVPGHHGRNLFDIGGPQVDFLKCRRCWRDRVRVE